MTDSDEEKALFAFNYFYHIFNATNFKRQKTQTLAQTALEKNNQSKIAIESDLQAIIYGTDGRDSLFEFIGSKLYEAHKKESLENIYENALYFVFRLLFIAYFEDKFDSLLDKHAYFNDEISLQTLLEKSDREETKFNTYRKLQEIFRIYDKGEPSYDMPVFNGGLFDEQKAPLLQKARIFSNADLVYILDSLFYFCEPSRNALFRFKRDYRTLNVEHLGTIYEGLLSYFFEIADEDMVYIKYITKLEGKAKEVEAYFDHYDFESIKKTHKILNAPQEYKKGQIYLKNTSNSRKSTASFYTPQTIATFLCQSALENLNNSNILHFKLLDNACGSGHFLIEALNQTSALVVNDWDHFSNLKPLYDQELQSIQKNICAYIKDYEVDESDVVKRLLLKRMIFGIDLNPFSVELTKLSLWIDSFIFGTPLSFIEHHIKCGNALIGTNIAEFKSYYSDSLKVGGGGGSMFINEFLKNFNALGKVFEKLDSLKDNTEEEIKESKRIYTQEITPSLEQLNLFLNLSNAKNFMNPQERKLLSQIEQAGIENLATPTTEEEERLKSIIETYAKKFRFFNYEIEFPEIAQENASDQPFGFQAIVGNPPWDKTKFSDADFFPQYRSNYRTLIKSQKNTLKTDLLDKPHIKAKYEEEKTLIESNNAYYKAHYPLNAGEGDGNLFRFFVERNLSLLSQGASLNYVLPSALMLEDGSFALRKEILENQKLIYFYSFENREGIFKDVDSRYKFALMSIQNAKASKTHQIKTMFYKTDIASIYNQSEVIHTSLQSIQTLSPAHLALQEVRSQKDLDILSKCYRSFPAFDALNFRRELDMTNDSDLFLEVNDDIPLFEGKMIHQFNSEFERPRYWLNIKAFDARLRSKEITRLKRDLKINEKEYQRLLESLYSDNFKEAIGKEEIEDSFICYDREFYRLGFRDIASDTNERTAIFSLLPKNCGYGHTLWGSVPKQYIVDSDKITIKPTNHIRILFALGIFNSIVIDYIVRGMVQINLSKTYLERIPFPRLSDEEITQDKTYKAIAINALKLQLFNDKKGDFKALQEEFKLTEDQLLKTQKQYDHLKAQNDITIAKLYGLEYEEFCYLLESFKVLNNKQPAFVSLLKNKTLWE